jgi:putative MATE family efflux protein
MNGGSVEEAVPKRASTLATEADGYRRVWALAWPVSISTSTVTLMTLANLFWIGHLGTVAVAAVSLSSHILFIVFGLSQTVYIGTVAVVSRRIGAEDRVEAFTACVHSVYLGALLGLAVALSGYVVSPGLIRFFDASPAVEDVAISYLRIMFAGQCFLFVSLALAASYQGTGDTRTPMLINVAVVLFHAAIDPFFIFAAGGFPLAGLPLGWLGLGVDGAAFASLLSGALGTMLFFVYSIARGRPLRRPRDQPLVFVPAELWRILRIGTPASVSFVARPISTFLLLKVIASFGTAAIAAFGIALRSFSLNWVPYSGINAAVSTLVGQNLGARDVAEAERVVWRGIGICLLLAVGFCAFYYGLSEAIMRSFDDNPEVVAMGTPFLQLIAFGFLFNGPMLPMVAAMNGAGDTKPPMIIAFLANWPVKLPLSYVLALPLGYGINGVWIGMLVSILFEAFLTYVWYWRGTWKTRKV